MKHVSAYRGAGLNPNRVTKKKPAERVSAYATEEKNRGGLLEGTGYVAGRLGLGLAGVGEGVLDIAAAGGDLLRGDTEMAKYRLLDNRTADAQQSLTDWYNPGKGMQFAGDATSAVGQSAVFLLDALIPGLGTGLFFTGITGQSVAGAAQQTGDVGLKELGYGVMSGAAEAALGKLVGAGGKVAGKLGSSLTRSTGKAIGQRGVTTALTKATGKKLASMGLNVAKNTLADAASEFTEEFADEYIDTGLQILFGIDPNASTSFGEALRAGAVGLVSGAAMGAPANVYNYKNSVAAGRAIREEGGVDQLLYRAAATVDVLKEQEEQAREKGRTKATVPEDAGVVGKTAAKGKQVVANLGDKIKASKTKGYWTKLEKNINAYTSMDETMRNSDVGDALLGELRGNLFFTNMSYAVEEAEEALKTATDEQITEWLIEVNDKAKKAGKADASYTVEDFRANKDGILSTVAAAFWIDEIRRAAKGTGNAEKATEKPAEATTSPWDGMADNEDVSGYKAAGEAEEALLKAAVKESVPRGSVQAMLDEFRKGTDMTPEEFAAAWSDGVHIYGRYGFDVGEESPLSRMSPEAREAAMKFGRETEEAERKAAEEKAKAKKKPAAQAGKKGAVVRGKGLEIKTLSDEQYAAYKAAEVLAEVLGTEIVIETAITDKKGRTVNGYYDTKTNRLHVNINALRDGKNISLYTLGHEVTHYIKEWSPAKFEALADFVLDQMGVDAETAVAEKLASLKRLGIVTDTMTIAEANALAREELVAEGMELVLTDGKVLEELSKTDKSLWEKIRDWFFDIIGQIRRSWQDLNQASKTAQVLKETVESLEEIERLFTEGVREAGERTRTAETTTDTNDGGRKLSFAGERAANANVETLSEAKRRIEAGEDSETVRQETGWFQGYDGKWRFEIDDSDAIFFSSGDARFSKNHPEYAEHSALTLKFILGDITPEELDRLTELGRTWGNEKRRLADRLKGGGATLEDVLQHDKLFEAYPELREVRVVVEDMDGTEKGRYTKRTNTITISSKLSAKEARKTLAHEVQHKIQEIEGFALGASPEYWARRENERSRENLDVIDQEIRYFDQKLRQMEKESGYEEFEQEVFERAMNGEISEEQYDAEIDKFMEEHPDLKKATQHMENLRRIRGETARRERIEDPSLLYRRTAGEVEARDVEQRIDMTEDKRKNTRPDIDREDVVFAEGSTVSDSFAGWTADGTEVYVTSPDVMKLSLSDRIQKFRSDFLQNFKGKTAKFERNGHTYYARFVETHTGLGKFAFEGQSKFSQSDRLGYKAKIRLIADGDIFSIVEDGKYLKSSPEQGKTTAAHANAKYWDYFWKEIFVDGKGYDVVINIRNDSASGNLADKEQFVYSMTFKENKKVAPPITMPASAKQVSVKLEATTDDSIAQTDGSVNRKFSISEEIPSTLSAEDQNLLFDADFYERYENESREPITETVEELEAAKASEAFATMSDDEAFDLNAKLKAKRAGYNTVYDYYVETEKERMAEEYRRYVQTGRSNRTSRTLEEKRKKAQKERTLRSDVDSATPLQNAQYQIIQEINPMWDEYHTGIRSPKEIKTFSEVAEDPDSFTWGDFTREDAQKALRDGTVRVYSSYAIKNGVFVSTSYKQALQYAGNNPDGVHTRVVALDSVAWINGDEGQYAKVYKDDGIRYSIDEDSDTAYLAAVERGDMETAQRMVDEAAKAAGYDVKAYHGTTNQEEHRKWDSKRNEWETTYTPFTVFKRQYDEQAGHFFSSDENNAGGYGSYLYSVFLMLKKPLVIECNGQSYNSILFDGQEMDTYEWAEYARKRRYDGVVFKNVRDGVGYGDLTAPTTDYVVFDSNRIKSADPVTYDNNGDIIPLSERFKVIQRDIRYSIDETPETPDVSENRDLTDREILGMALEGAVQSQEEYNIVKSYREQAALLELVREKRDGYIKEANALERQIKALRVRMEDEGDPDGWIRKAMDDAIAKKREAERMRDEQVKILDNADRELLRMKAAKPFREILAREQKRVRAAEYKAERAEEKAEKARETTKRVRKEYQEKIYKARRDATDYKRAVYRTAYAKADEKVERAKAEYEAREEYKKNRREMSVRERVARRVVGRMNTMFYNPTKTKHVPADLQALVEAVLKSEKLDTFKETRKNLRQMAEMESEIEKLEQNPARTAKEQEKLDKLHYKYAMFEDEGMDAKSQAVALYTAFKEWMERRPPDLQDKDLLEQMSADIDAMQDMPLSVMSMKSLEAVEDFYKKIYHQVNTANQAFATERAANIDQMSTKANAQVKEAKELKFLSPRAGEWAALAGVRSFLWKNMKPLTVFEAIGSDELMSIFKRVLDGEDVWITDILEAKKALDEAKKEYGYNRWNLKERREVTTADGSKVSLTLGEMMSLYAYMFRDQAEEHLSAGGFVFAPNAEAIEGFKGDKVKYRTHLNDQKPHRMRKEDIAKMSDMLTEEQRAYAKRVQEYLTSLGEKGNEVSRKLYGIDLFKETAYFPIKSSHDYIETSTGKSGDPNIKSRGTFKETVPNAGNPIVLEDFMEVVGNHVNTMATYHAFVLPVEDLTRVWNYTPVNIKRDADGKAILDENGMPVADTEGEAGYNSLKAEITKKYGKEANDYILQLLRDLNGGARRESAASILDKGLTAFKRSATMLSLSTIVQQPTSILRAMAYVDAKHFKGASIVPWETVKKYAPVAVIKEVGGHDTNTGARTVDYINAKEYDSIKDAAKAAVTPEIYGGDPNVRAEAFGWLTGKFDEISWRYLFGAIVNEQAEKLGKAKDSEAVLKAAGERFAEVVRRTQVYDSTLTRSEYMRSKDGLMKVATAFGAEPTTVVSMAVDAIIKAERGDKTFLRKSAAGIAFSVIANAAVASLIYAMRDDDEDETIPEKYVQSLTSELIEGFNPLEYLPIARDVMSMFKGYEIERSDMALIGNLMEQVELITNSKRSVPDKIFGVTGAVSAFFGLPVTNVYRDLKGLVKTGQSFTDAEEQTGAGFGFAMGDAVSGQFNLFAKLFGAESGNAYELYTSYVRGDTAHYERVKARYETDKDAEMALRTELRDNDKRINQAAWAKHTGDMEVYESLVDQIESEGIFDRNIVIRAVNNEVSEIKREIEEDNLVPRDETDTEEEENSESLYKTSDLNNALTRGDREDFEDIYYYLLATKQEQGKTEAQAKAAVKSGITSYWKKKYLAAWEKNNTAEMKRILELLEETELYGEYNDVATMASKWIKES